MKTDTYDHHDHYYRAGGNCTILTEKQLWATVEARINKVLGCAEDDNWL